MISTEKDSIANANNALQNAYVLYQRSNKQMKKESRIPLPREKAKERGNGKQDKH